jgi:hypothetical protein
VTKANKTLTAGDLINQLAADPAYVAREAAKDRARELKAHELIRAGAALRADLAAIGIDVQSVWDLVNGPQTHVRAVPVLLRHIRGDYPPEILEGIARALALPEVAYAYWELVERLLAEPHQSVQVRYALALAVGVATTEATLSHTIDLACDKTLGECRAGFLMGLQRFRSTKEMHIRLADLLKDPILGDEARATLLS